MVISHCMGTFLKLVGEIDGMRERHTVKADTFPVARPNPRAAGIAGDVNFVVEVWIIDYDFVGVDSEDRAYSILTMLNCYRRNFGEDEFEIDRAKTAGLREIFFGDLKTVKRWKEY